jgi:uncharacterized membrane protein SirB2
MRRLYKILMVILVVLLFFLSFVIQSLASPVIDHFWTKAIYNGTHLQDFVLYCSGPALIRMVPIGDAIYVGRNWTYPAYVPKSWRERFCKR